MPSNSPMFDNAWLNARKPGKDTTRDIMHSTDEQKRRLAQVLGPQGGADPVVEAREFLLQPSVIDTPLSAEDESGLNARLDWNKQNNALGTEIAARQASAKRGSLRNFTEGMSTVGSGVQLAGLGAAFTPAAPAAGPMMLGGTALTLPDQLRRAYLPQDDEQEPDLMEAGMTGLGFLPGMSMARTAAKGAETAEGIARGGARLRKTFGVHQAEEVPYRMGSSVPTSSVPSRPSLDWLDDTLSQGRGLPPVRPELSKAFPNSDGDAWTNLGKLGRRREGFDPAMARTQHRSVQDMSLGRTAAESPVAASKSAAERAGFPQIEADEILRRFPQPRPTPPTKTPFTSEAGSPDLPGLSIDSPGWNALGPVPTSRAMRPQATQSGNLVLDRPLKELYAQRAKAVDPAELDQLGRAIRQQEMLRRMAGQ